MMPLTDCFAAPTETAGDDFGKLMKEYEPTIIEVMNQNILKYSNYLNGSSDHNDLMQVARYAFWEANEKFDNGKAGQNSKNQFITLVTQTLNDRISDFLKKHYKNVSAESFNSEENSLYNIPDETSPEPMKSQMLRLIKDRLPRLTPRETRYLNLVLFDEWKAR